jgi:dynein heavy chain
MKERFKSLSLGQGQSENAKIMLQKGIKKGYWVFLANCHLSISWMPELEKIVEQLQKPSANVHKKFRLWLSSSPHPKFPISILQSSVKMTTEPPSGIKANMKRLYNLVTEEKFDQCQAREKYKRLLFSLTFFHAVLIERRKFEQLGWNTIYSFNDSDFDISENILSIYLNEYDETPWDALKYMIADINYGGHITDGLDKKLLVTYAEDMFNDDVINVPHYQLSGSPLYCMPRDGPLKSYHDFVNSLPSVDVPEVFGQHQNANITSLIIEAKMNFRNLLLKYGNMPNGQ